MAKKKAVPEPPFIHTTSSKCNVERRWKEKNFYTENISINLTKCWKCGKNIFNREKNFFLLKWAFYSSEMLNSALHKKQ